MLADSHHPVFKKLVSCLAVYSLHKHSAAILASILKQLEYLFKIKINKRSSTALNFDCINNIEMPLVTCLITALSIN